MRHKLLGKAFSCGHICDHGLEQPQILSDQQDILPPEEFL